MSSESPGVDLHQLIQTLKPREKRYFRLHAGHKDEADAPNYMRLYAAMQEMPAWSEEELRKTFAGAPFLKQLNVACNYLYDLLLASLRAYDQDKTFHSEAHRRLDEVVLLFQRKLYGPCLRRTRLAIKFANQLDLPQLHLELLQWELRLLRQFPGRQQWVRTLAATEECQALMQQIHKENVLYGLYSRLFLLASRPSSETQADRVDWIAAIAADPALQESPRALAFDAQMLYHLIHSLLAHLSGDDQRFAQANADMLDCWEANPRRIAVEEERYLKTLIGFVESAVETAMLDLVPGVIAKMRRLCQRSPVLEAGYGLLVRNMELRFLLNTKAFDKALQFCEEVERYLSQRTDKNPPAGMIAGCTNAALIHFIMESWGGCLEWLARMEPLVRGGLRKEITLWVGPLRIVALYAASRLDELEKAVRTWRRHPDAGIVGPLIADAFTALNRCNSDGEERQALEHLRQSLLENQGSAPVLNLVENWVTSRLKRAPLRNFYQPR